MTDKKKTIRNREAGQRLKAFCQEKGYATQKALAEKTEIDEGTISKIFSGETGKPSEDNVKKIVEALSADSREFILDKILEIYENSECPYSDDEKQRLRKKCVPSEPLPQILRHNLKANRGKLIGRERELALLLEALSFESGVHRIGIEGAGGVGKTALILEAARRCKKKSQGSGDSTTISPRPPVFDVIIFTSAQTARFEKDRIWPNQQAERTLREILQTVARVLDVDISDADPDALPESIQQILTRQRTLLILDNLETLEDLEAVGSFLDRIPENVKVAIASRHHIPFSCDRLISLKCLPQEKATRLVEERAEGNDKINLSSEDAEKLAKKMECLPLAIVYSVGQLAYSPLGLKDILERSLPPDVELARYCVENSINLLKKEQSRQSYKLFLAIAIFRQSPSLEAVSAVAAVRGDRAIAEGFFGLNKLGLVERYETGQQERYGMHSFAREYARSQLQADPDFESEARDRWIDWYRQFAEKHGGKDWREWQDFSEIEEEWENLTEVIEWCIDRQLYDEVLHFWRYIKSYSYARGRNSDRHSFWTLPLEWTKWLLETAEKKKDWSAAAELNLDLGQKLSLRRDSKDLDRAVTILDKAWKLRNYKDTDTSFKLDVAISQAHVSIEQEKFARAYGWVQNARKLLNDATKLLAYSQENPAECFPPSQLEKERILVRVLFCEGDIYYKTKKYDEAKQKFEAALTKAKSLQWKRAEALAQDWLAHIAIAQGDLETAQKLLTKSREAAEKRQDKCRMAYCDLGLGRIEFKKDNFKEASELFEQAEEAFRSLGMIPEAEETAEEIRKLPQELEAKRQSSSD